MLHSFRAFLHLLPFCSFAYPHALKNYVAKCFYLWCHVDEHQSLVAVCTNYQYSFFFHSVVKQFESNRNICNKLSDEVELTWTSFVCVIFVLFCYYLLFCCCCRYWACIRMDKLWQALAEETWQISANTDWLILPEGPWLVITLSETQISIVIDSSKHCNTSCSDPIH